MIFQASFPKAGDETVSLKLESFFPTKTLFFQDKLVISFAKTLGLIMIKIKKLMKFEDKQEKKRKSIFEINYATVVRVSDEIKKKRISKKLFYVMCKLKFILH